MVARFLIPAETQVPLENVPSYGGSLPAPGETNGTVAALDSPPPFPLPIPLPRPIAASSFDDVALDVEFRDGKRRVSAPLDGRTPERRPSLKPSARVTPVVRYLRRRTNSATVEARHSDEESIISTASSTLDTPKSPPADPEAGLVNVSFTEDDVDASPHPPHIDAGLPPVDIVEDVATAAKMPNDIPIIDALVVEGVHIGKEKLRGLVLQIFVPFLLAGFGMVGAGILLDTAQSWSVFVEISEILVMVPALLGLKGNLEMTLASRLSTQVNIGGFDVPRRKWRIIGCNMALNQVLATGVGFLASMMAVVMYAINHQGGVKTRNIVLMLGTAMLSACSTSIVQDSVMIGTVLFAQRFRLNPDNIATPVAGSIGDVLTLGILAGFSYLFYSAFETGYWMVGPVVAVCGLVCLLPLWVWVARKEPSTRHVLVHGWVPVVMAMLISSCSGIILEKVLSTGADYFKGLPVFQPLINGVGGNIVSVQASRIATYLHLAYTQPGHVPPGYAYCHPPCHSFCSRSNVNARTARLLLLMVVPGHLIFLFTISFAHAGSTSISLRFAVVFLVMALLQVALLLYGADILTHFVWKKGLDPDNQTIPYLTALGDLLGTGLLALAFWFLYITRSGKSDKDVG